jgi:hypothetical protein
VCVRPTQVVVVSEVDDDLIVSDGVVSDAAAENAGRARTGADTVSAQRSSERGRRLSAFRMGGTVSCSGKPVNGTRRFDALPLPSRGSGR